MTTESRPAMLWIKVADLVIKAAGLFAIWLTLQSYLDQHKQELEQNKKAFGARLYEKQIDVYVQTCEMIEDILDSDSTAKMLTKIKRFNKFQTGKLLLLCDEDVFAAVVGLQRLLPKSTDDTHTQDQIEATVRAQLEVIAACRNSLRKSVPNSLLGSHSFLEFRKPQDENKPMEK